MLTPKDYQDALLVQDACNLSGVVHSFADVITRIDYQNTEERNTHPICKLYADKIADLAKVRTFDEYSDAYQECVKESKRVPD